MILDRWPFRRPRRSRARPFDGLHADAATGHPTPAWFRREGMPLTDPLSDELAAGRCRQAFLMAPGSDAPRAPFLFADAIDPASAAYAPFVHHFSDPGFRNFAPVPVRFADLGHAHVCGIDGVVFTGGRIVRETTANIVFWNDVAGVEAFEPERSVRFRDDLRFFRKVVPGEFFLGATATSPNYAHWMMECLPRLVIFLMRRMHRPALKLVLPPCRPDSFQQATLDLLGIREEDVYRIPPRCVVGFESLSAAFGIDMIAVSPLMAQAGWLMRAAHAARDPADTLPERRPIYLHRPAASVRRVVNFDACRPVIEAAGFSIESFDGRPLHEQIARMRSASCLVAEHGAGLANMLFCEPGTPVAELFSPATVQPSFWSLASRCGLPFGFVVGDHADEPPSWNADYRLDPAKLAAILAATAAKAG